MKKSLGVIVAAAVLTSVCSFRAWATEGWENQGGDWYYYEPGTGTLVMGWKEIDGKWYYLDGEKGGKMYTGWKEEDNKRYYLGSDGAMIQNSMFCTCPPWGYGDGYVYYATEDGSVRRNMVDNENKIIYDELGRVKMKDALSVASGVATGEDFYQYIVCEHYLEQSVHDQKENVRSAIKEYLEKCAERYDKDVRHVKSSRYSARFEEWKEKLFRGMQDYVYGTIYEEDFDTYIREVVKGTFENADEYVDGLPLYYFEEEQQQQ